MPLGFTALRCCLWKSLMQTLSRFECADQWWKSWWWMAGFTATVRAGSQLSREAQGYGLVTEIYGLMWCTSEPKTDSCQLQKEGEMPSFLMEVEFSSYNILQEIMMHEQRFSGQLSGAVICSFRSCAEHFVTLVNYWVPIVFHVYMQAAFAVKSWWVYIWTVQTFSFPSEVRRSPVTFPRYVVWPGL